MSPSCGEDDRRAETAHDDVGTWSPFTSPTPATDEPKPTLLDQ
jgi:hypothetical protein